jgi:tellurite resistance protein
MAESQILSVIRMWAAIAWADGELADAEADGLRRLIRTAELTPEERSEAEKLLEAKVVLTNTDLRDLDPAARYGIYRAACKMAVVDHVFAAAERQMLDKLRVVLDLSDEIANHIESGVPGIV